MLRPVFEENSSASLQDMMDVDLDMALKVHEFLDIKGAITEHYQKEEERRQNLKNSTGR